ncbi:hypothetical protein [Stenomitos frigidus]|uniref:hypothetical protein n=1 Tax=Stenomitos frigidus TaxID=1886765 RepID=UPI0015E64C38|nr:hypothetical protein [Stenomitos frigidus]
MQPTPHTQPTALAPRAECTPFRPLHTPKLTMIWVTESVGDRTRLTARWTTQD